jgi:hypothetical protein
MVVVLYCCCDNAPRKTADSRHETAADKRELAGHATAFKVRAVELMSSAESTGAGAAGPATGTVAGRDAYNTHKCRATIVEQSATATIPIRDNRHAKLQDCPAERLGTVSAFLC